MNRRFLFVTRFVKKTVGCVDAKKPLGPGFGGKKKRGDIFSANFLFLEIDQWWPMLGNHLVAKLQPEDYDMPMSNDVASHPQQIFTKIFGGLVIMSSEFFFQHFLGEWMRQMHWWRRFSGLVTSARLALGNPAAALARLLRFRKHGGRRNWGANVLHHLRQRCWSKTNKFHGCYLAVLTVVHILRRQETSSAD